MLLLDHYSGVYAETLTCLHSTELGHWKLRHTPVNFVMGQIITLVQFLLFTLMRNSEGLYDSFGFTEARPAFIAFLLFQFVISPVDEVGRAGGGRGEWVQRARALGLMFLNCSFEEEQIKSRIYGGNRTSTVRERRRDPVISRALLLQCRTAGTSQQLSTSPDPKQKQHIKSRCMLRSNSRALGHPATYLCIKLGSRQR
jgi:hypothetical protein